MPPLTRTRCCLEPERFSREATAFISPARKRWESQVAERVRFSGRPEMVTASAEHQLIERPCEREVSRSKENIRKVTT